MLCACMSEDDQWEDMKWLSQATYTCILKDMHSWSWKFIKPSASNIAKTMYSKLLIWANIHNPHFPFCDAKFNLWTEITQRKLPLPVAHTATHRVHRAERNNSTDLRVWHGPHTLLRSDEMAGMCHHISTGHYGLFWHQFIRGKRDAPHCREADGRIAA
jgi:hypothetical protein